MKLTSRVETSAASKSKTEHVIKRFELKREKANHVNVSDVLINWILLSARQTLH